MSEHEPMLAWALCEPIGFGVWGLGFVCGLEFTPVAREGPNVHSKSSAVQTAKERRTASISWTFREGR